MRENDMEQRNRYFEELTINLTREGFTAHPQEDGLLPVQWKGSPLCRVSCNGIIRYRQEDMTDADRKAARHKVAHIVGVTAEYMKQMEQAPALTANGLNGSYKVLAEFNNTVFAGHQNQYGVQFVTWEWSYDHTSVCQGHYAAHHYEEAKRDFAVRSGLLKKEQLFSHDQLIEIYRCCADTLDAGYDLTYEQEARIRSVQEQIQAEMPDILDRIQEQGQMFRDHPYVHQTLE